MDTGISIKYLASTIGKKRIIEIGFRRIIIHGPPNPEQGHKKGKFFIFGRIPLPLGSNSLVLFIYPLKKIPAR